MTKFVGSPLRGFDFSTVADEALSARVHSDNVPRIRIDAGGKITWGPGNAAGDTNLYRSGENLLTTDDVFKATGGVVTLTTNGPPNAALDTGALAIDITNDDFYFRSQGIWTKVSGNASISVSDTAPADAESGAMWFDSTSLDLFIYYGSAWVQLTNDTTIEELADLFDVELTNLIAGQVLKYDGEKWINGKGSSTTVSDTAPANPESGDLWYDSTALALFIYYQGGWVELNPDVQVEELSDLFDIEFANLIAGQVLKYDGEKWINGKGSSTTVGDTAPANPEAGDLWYDSVSLSLFIYYSSNWVELNPDTGAEELSDLTDINITTPTNGQVLQYNGTEWINATPAEAAGNASVTVSQTAPAGPTEGDLWFESDTAKTFIYYDSQWIEVGPQPGGGAQALTTKGDLLTRNTSSFARLAVGTNGYFLKADSTTATGLTWSAIPTINNLDDVGDVTITSATNGQFLKWNGSAWVNDSIPTINTLDDVGDVTITSATNGDLLKWNGSAWVNAAGYALLASPTFTGTVTVPTPVNNTDAATKQYVDTAASNAASAAEANAQAYANALSVSLADLTDGVTASAAEINILDGATLSTAELNYVDGVTSAIQTQLDAKAPLASPTFTGTATTNNLVVSGNLTVSGTTTSINTETLTVDDNIIVLNNNATGAPSENAGIEVERGSSTNVSIRWNESTDKWQFTNDGSTYVDLDKGPVTISSTAPVSPVNGQLWFYQDTAQTFIYYGSTWIEIGAVSNGARVEVSPVAPASPVTGDLWFDSDTAQTFTYYDSQWIEIGASGMAASVGDSAPASPVNGQIWFDSSNASTNVYYDSQWIEVGGSGGSTVTISDTAPNPPTTGQLWFNSLTGATFVYYGSVWVEVGVAPFDQLLSTLDAKGDLLVGTADNAVTKLPVGSNNQVLTADSSTASGLKWSTPTTYATTGKAIAMSIVFGG